MIATQKDNREEMFPLVDEEGNIIGAATRGECHNGSKCLHPVVHLHVFNSRGELYLQKRPQWKDIQPGKWDTSVGGHVDLGESVEMALKREAGEELGISDFTSQLLTHYVFESDREKELVILDFLAESRQRHLGQAFTHPNAAADFLRLKMGEYEREVFAVMLLDNQHRLLDYQELFFGTIGVFQDSCRAKLF